MVCESKNSSILCSSDNLGTKIRRSVQCQIKLLKIEYEDSKYGVVAAKDDSVVSGATDVAATMLVPTKTPESEGGIALGLT